MSTVIKRCRGEKKRGKKKKREIDGFRKNLMIPDSEISECTEQEVKSKIGNIFVNEKVLEEYSFKIYKIGPYFSEHCKEKMQADKSGCEYILFRIDVSFTEYLLAVEIGEKKHVGRDLIFGEKTKNHQKRNLVVNLLELIQVKKAIIQTMKQVEYKHLSVSLKTNN